MNKDIAKLWTAALRSGKYEQGQRALHSIKNNNETFCCLGVLCDLYQQDRRKKEEKCLSVDKTDLHNIAYNHMRGSLPLEVMYWSGIASSIGGGGKHSLITLNDKLGYDFNRIAEFIEVNVEYL